MKIGFAQINPTVGDLKGNCELIISAYQRLACAGAELVLTPELAITGYPPQDLVFKSRFVSENLALLEKLHAHVGESALLVGFVDRNQGRGKPFHNAAALLERGKPIRKTYKCHLPTYDVFDEDRYFEPASRTEPFQVNGKKVGVTICEDIWTDEYLPRPLYNVEPVRALVKQRAEIILNLSASPFRLGAPACRLEMIAAQARTYRRPIYYCNVVGGSDQLVFDGNSIVVNASGNLVAHLPAFREDEKIVDTDSRRQNAGATFRSAFAGAARLLPQVQLPVRCGWSEWRSRFRCHRGDRGRCARRRERNWYFNAQPILVAGQHRGCARTCP
jgi:predicted amidohydrolase